MASIPCPVRVIASILSIPHEEYISLPGFPYRVGMGYGLMGWVWDDGYGKLLIMDYREMSNRGK